VRKTLWLMALSLTVILATVGCVDIAGRFRPADFGGSAQEQAMVNALIAKHGDLRGSGPPRIIETMMTSRVENGMPADRVSEYSKDTKNLHAWFVYDNFNEGEIEIEWIYRDRNHSIHTFKAKTGKDFGRGTFILEQPSGGWPLGSYAVIVRGMGVSSTVEFKMVAGATQSTPILLPGGKVELPRKPGWHFVSVEYIIDGRDVTRHPRRYYTSTAAHGGLFDFMEGTGGKNDFTLAVWRTYADGSRVAGSKSNSKWEDPPTYIEPDKKLSMRIQHSYAPPNNTWGQTSLGVHFDSVDLQSAGFVTAGVIRFEPTASNTVWHAFDGIVESRRVIPRGKAGDRRAIWVGIAHYSFKYTYEWRD